MNAAAESPSPAPVSMRRIALRDVPALHALSAEQKWPHRLDDWRLLLRMGSGFVACRDDEVVGCVMHWCFGDHHASIGMLIVSPRAQGQGLGRALMQASLQELGERSVSLHATEAGRPLYEKLGFEPVGWVAQHQGSAYTPGVSALERGERVRPMGRHEAQTLALIDAQGTGMMRATMMAELLGTAHGVVLDRDGEAQGFALQRRFGLGHAIGPVLAESDAHAKALITHWVGSRGGSFMRVDVPEASGLSAWLEGLGLPQTGRVLAMRRGPAALTHPRLHRFALVSQALG